MSLIQEALKRQMQESEGAQPSEPTSTALPEPPVTETIPVRATAASPREIPPPVAEAPVLLSQPAAPPPPVPVPPPPPRRASSAPRGLRIAGLAVGILIILVVGGALALKHVWKYLASRELKTATVPVVAPVPPVPVPVEPPPPVVPSLTNAGATGNPPAVPVPPEPVATVSSPAPATLPVPPPEDEDLTNQPVPPPQPPVLATPPRTNPVPLAWPSLKLTGILASSRPSEGAARINNQLIFVGGEINGVVLAEIRADGVLLKYKGENKFLRVGGMIY